MAVTATISNETIATGSLLVEFDTDAAARFTPTVPANAIATVAVAVTENAATISSSVVTTLVAGGAVDAVAVFSRRQSRVYVVTWTVTTADANPNVFVRSFTMRPPDACPSGLEVRSVHPAVGYERVEARSLRRSAVRVERLEASSVRRRSATVEGISVFAIGGLPLRYARVERVEVIAATREEGIAYLLSMNVGDGDEYPYLLSEEVERLEDDPGILFSEEVMRREDDPGYLLSLNFGSRDEFIYHLAMNVGSADEFPYLLSLEIISALLEAIEAKTVLRSEELAALEDAEE